MARGQSQYPVAVAADQQREPGRRPGKAQGTRLLRNRTQAVVYALRTGVL
ncbi:hypothetical protein [Kitasatospora sp. GP82]|nr:hypothetical protein [Kitasatospora sp. GP82]